MLYDGKPLVGTRVLATYHIYDGDGFRHELFTDEIGALKFIFDARGHWMFRVHATQAENEYIATLVIPGVR